MSNDIDFAESVHSAFGTISQMINQGKSVQQVDALLRGMGKNAFTGMQVSMAMRKIHGSGKPAHKKFVEDFYDFKGWQR